MALFGKKKKKQAKEQAKLDAQYEKERKILQKFGVENLQNPQDIASVRKIANELTGSGIMEAGLKLTKPEAAIPIALQRSIVEQNFIIIRQLDELLTLMRTK